MALEEIVRSAHQQRATDIHLEPTLPISLRINGELRRLQTSVSRDDIHAMTARLLRDDAWDDFNARGSYDLAKTIAGVQCRINVMRDDRGIGMAIRLLSTQVNTLVSCNLHPQLADFVKRDTGLILLCGPTGSGKSTTLAALIEEINQHSNRHIITLESPIEYRVQPKKSFIRQREVGVHTPSYEQGLMDCLREDPDVIVVGEMRDAESMRWTLNAAETGHLVIATMHAANSADAVYRMMMSFSPERQASVLAQLGDALIAIVTQRMSFRENQQLVVPVLEILVGTHATKNAIRKGEATKLLSLLQAGGSEGSWTFERYQTWLDEKSTWVYPAAPVASDLVEDVADAAPVPSAVRVKSRTTTPPPTTGAAKPRVAPPGSAAKRSSGGVGEGSKTKINKDGRIEIPDLDIDLNDLVREIPGDDE